MTGHSLFNIWFCLVVKDTKVSRNSLCTISSDCFTWMPTSTLHCKFIFVKGNFTSPSSVQKLLLYYNEVFITLSPFQRLQCQCRWSLCLFHHQPNLNEIENLFSSAKLSLRKYTESSQVKIKMWKIITNAKKKVVKNVGWVETYIRLWVWYLEIQGVQRRWMPRTYTVHSGAWTVEIQTFNFFQSKEFFIWLLWQLDAVYFLFQFSV